MTKTTVDIARTRAAFDRAIDDHEQVLGKFFLARLLGLEVSYTAPSCTVSFTVEDFMLNPGGTLHGGVIALVTDMSMGHLLAQNHGPAVTLEIKVQYMKAIRTGTKAHAVATMAHAGSSVCFLESRLCDESGRLCALASATWKRASQS